MIFAELNDGTKVNLVHTSSIEQKDNKIIYKQAKGSDIIEYFDTEEEAQTKYDVDSSYKRRPSKNVLMI